MKFQIISDSSCDLQKNDIKSDKFNFEIAPLIVRVGQKEYYDNEDLDVEALRQDINTTKEDTASACPAPETFSQYFDNAEYTFIVTLTGKLSGCYNSARVAKNNSEKKDKIHIFDSMGTSGVMILIIEEIARQIEAGKSFEEIIKEVDAYIAKQHLFFILHRFDNLVANGRMSKFAGFMAKTLVIKPICTAKNGSIDMIAKCLGSLNAYKKLVELCAKRCEDYSDRTLIITHNNNLEDAEKIKSLVLEKCNFKDVRILPTRGLCSYYAQDKGLIICF